MLGRRLSLQERPLAPVGATSTLALAMHHEQLERLALHARELQGSLAIFSDENFVSEASQHAPFTQQQLELALCEAAQRDFGPGLSLAQSG